MDNDTILTMTTSFSALAAVFSAVAAVCAVYLTWLTVKRTAATKRAEIHSRFQSEIRSIQQKLSQGVNDPDNWQPTPEEKRYIRMYWYAVFDEWVICHKEDKSLVNLWLRYYAQGVSSSLKNIHFEASIKEMFDGQSSFFDYRNEFKDVINDIYGSLHNGRILISN